MTYILHIAPDSINKKNKPFIGSTKDIEGRTEYFRKRKLPVQQLISVDRSDAATLDALKSSDLSNCVAILFEYEMYIESMRYLRDQFPHIRRIVRAHNANFPHWLDYFRGRLRMRKPSMALDHVRTAIQRFAKDRACSELADDILAISDWEAEHYWSALASEKTQVLSVPYFVPSRINQQIQAAERRNLCVCFMGTSKQMQPLLYDAGKNTIQLINALPSSVNSQWEFYITGNLSPRNVLGRLGRVQSTGLLKSPLPVLAQARVVTILSDLGMGFKTKILEAAMAGCWVLVTQDLFNRLPNAIRPWCKVVDQKSPSQFAETLDACRDTPPQSDPNAAFRQQAFTALDAVFNDIAGLKALKRDSLRVN